MKRILSVILSLALLASLLIIPMSVSAGVEDNSVITTTEFSNSDAVTYYSEANNLARGITPFVFVTDNRDKNNPTRTNKTVNGALSDGNTGNGGDIALGFAFRNPNTEGKYLGDYLNGYKEYVQDDDSTHFDFTKNANQYDAYADIIYDLGTTADINKVQQFGPDGNDKYLSIGAYQVYASADMNTLFDAKSLVLNYQNKTPSADLKSCQQHEFANRNARFVAFRIYCPVTRPASWQTSAVYYNTLRIKELAIYGEDKGNYKVSDIAAPSSETQIVPPAAFTETGNLLSRDNLTVTGKDGNDDKTFEMKETDRNHLSRFINRSYTKDGHADFSLGVTFYADGSFKNGYKLETNTYGSINFRDDTQPITNYVDFTYELDSYYKLSQFELYSCTDSWSKLIIQAYEVYLSADRDDLYSADNKVAEYNNYFNTYGQKFEFNKRYTGKYLGVRVLMAANRPDSANYVRLDEMVAYGEEVGTPPVIQVEDGATCGSAVVTVTDEDHNLASVKVNDQDVQLDEDGKFTISEIGKYTVVATDDKGNVTTKEINVADHNYKYTAKDNVITETCGKGDIDAKTLTLTKPATIVYDSSGKSGSIDAVKTEGFANTAGKGDIVFEKGGKPVDPADVKNAGDYVAKLTIGDATAVLPFTIEKALPKYTAPEDKAGEAGKELSTIKLDDGFTWKNRTEKIKYSNGDKFEYDAIYTPADVDNYKIAELKIKVNGTDITPPTGTIKIKETVWDKLANLFIKDRETVTITGSDADSGVDKILYYVTDAEVDDSALANVEWTDYTGSFKIEKEGNNFVYAKIVDVAGKVTVISTDGIVLDTKAPSADVTNLGKYYGSLTVTVKDDNLDTVKLNGKDVTLDEEGKFVVDAADGAQKIVITDKAGNETTYTVTVVEVKGFNPAEGKLTVDMDEKNVDTAGKEKIAEKIEKGETVTFFDISVDNATGSTANVLEVPVDFDFTGKLNVRVLHKHGGNVNELKALTARPTAGFENGTFFADKENGKLYIYSKEFSPFAVAYHVHDVKHVEAKAATAEADGNIEYWYCEGCDKYFSDAAATKEIQKADTVVKYVAPSNGNTGSGSNAPTTGGETENNATVPGGTSPVTGETAMTVVLFAILLGAIAVMGISIVKSRKAKSK